MDFCEYFTGPPYNVMCLPIEPPLRGAVSAVVWMHSTDGMGAMVVLAYQFCPDDTSPDGLRDLIPALRIEIDHIPAGTTVVVDSAQRKVVIISDEDGSVSDGTFLVNLEPGKGIEWIDVRDCDDIHCFCVGSAHACTWGTVDITTYSQHREA